MSTLAQHKYPLSPYHQTTTCHRRFLLRRTRVYCSSSTSTTATKLKSDDKQLVIDPQLEPPKPVAIIANFTDPPSSKDPSLQSTWSHRAWVTAGCTTVLVSLAKCISQSAILHVWFEPVLAGWVGYILADLGSGVYHWGIDNYGDGSTPVFGSQIEAFQGHHKWPWTITRRQFANNLHALARAVTFTVLPIELVCNDPTLLGFVGMCSGCIMFSQQFHAWAHGTKSRLPPLVVALQDAGVLVSRSQHAAHHRPPYNDNYCIVSGAWNEFLDEHKVFQVLEMILYFKFGVRPRSWSEPNSEWLEDTEVSS